MKYKYVVVENYRDGGTFRHHFFSMRDARMALEDMQEAHLGRTYELVTL